jgi:hypothetical protein
MTKKGPELLTGRGERSDTIEKEEKPEQARA